MKHPLASKLWKYTAIAAAVGGTTLLMSCGGSDNEYPEISSGTLIDSAVSGIGYATASQAGTTNENGEFSYVEGETVIFSVGGIQFPAVVAGAIITPLDIAGANSPYDPVANNIARVLQSLDSDRNPNNGISISSSAASVAAQAQVSDWSDTSALEALFTNTFGSSMVSASAAAAHLTATLNEVNGYAGLTLIGRFNEGQELDEGIAEIVAYHKNSQSICVINASASTVDILNASELTSAALANPLSASNLERRSQLNVAGDVNSESFAAGGINSVAVQGDLMAVAVENDDKQAAGVVAFYTLNEAGEATFVKSVAAGALPDNVQISSDGAYVVVANEGEPSGDYSNDPEGSVTVIAVTGGIPADVGTQITFEAFNAGGARGGELNGVRIFAGAESVAQDLEPEYVAFSDDNSKAFVSMQENNAIAVIDLAAGSVERIFGLGTKDHSVAGNGLDASNRDECTQEDIDDSDCATLNDGINIKTWDNLKGFYMPDSIASFASNGVNYVLTANEGDSREYAYDASEEACEAAGHTYDDGDCFSHVDEIRVKDLDLDTSVFTDDSLQDNENLGRLKVVTTEGDADEDGLYEALYSFGGRSFSIFNADTGSLVFDSGDDFEQITATVIGGEGFNSTDDENAFDDRSDDKGPEPEALAVGTVNGKTYAFIGLERVGGIMVYDITDPATPAFVEYSVNRDYSVDIEDDLGNAGDLAPEGMKFVAAADSPTGKALLIVGNEVSGTTTVYEVK